MREKKAGQIIGVLAVVLFAALMLLLMKEERGGGAADMGHDDEALFREQEKAAAEDMEETFPMSIDCFLLDTYCSISIYEGGGREALEKASELLNAFDGLFSPKGEGSDIARINGRSGDTVPIADETAGLLLSVAPVCESSGGDLELTIEPLSSLWDIKERKAPPDESEIEAARTRLDPEGWCIEETEEGWLFHSEEDGLRLDVGAVAKGYIADRIKEELVAKGVSSGIINLGGNVLCIGSQPSGEPFVIGIRKPGDEPDSISFKIEIDDGSVVTAGIYERYFEYEGRIYHHIIDPKTGYPVENELSSVTVTGDCSAICDALATTLLIKGTKEGSIYLSSFNERYGMDYRAYFIDKELNVTGPF